MEKIDIGLEGAKLEAVDLSKELLVLRLAFGKLKAAVSDAMAPVNAVLVEAMSKAVFWAIRLAKNIGKVIAALFGMQAAGKAAAKSVAAGGDAAERSLAGFDQIQRLDGDRGEAVSVSVSVQESGELSPALAAIVEKIRALLTPLTDLDFLPLRWNLARLGETLDEVSGQIARAVEWIWFEILTPFAAWMAEKLAPVFLKTLKEALEAVSSLLEPLGAGFGKLWQALSPVTQELGMAVLTALDQLRRLFVNLTDTLSEKSEKLTAIFDNVSLVVTRLWQVVGPILEQLRIRWALTFEEIGETVSKVAGFIIDSLYGVTEFLAGVFTGDWSRAWKGLGEILKGHINSVIGFLNMLLTGVAGGLNAIITMVNKLKFTAPDWVPGIGGKTFGFQLSAVKAPQIPYLAKGAVLPANRPFLAVVGDQTHGTNVEAPLATIQEAVALVMQEQLEAVMAGFDATVSEIRQLHDTVGGIQVGDTVIGKAARRYERKMAVVNGRPY